MLQASGTTFNVYHILEKQTKEYSVIAYFNVFLNKLKRLIGIDIKQATYDKYENVIKSI